MIIKEYEIWADSFHEGYWCCSNIAKIMNNKGYSVKYTYKNGFQPYFVINNDKIEIRLIVYGSYGSWNNIPNKISELIKWGKPDFVAYDSNSDKVLFAVEETAATATGNQSSQRLERQYGSSRFQIPYWYLSSEYGIHSDGKVRRDSIWPIISAIKLSVLNTTPCLVLHYSDRENLENYSAGNGIALLFNSISQLLINSTLNISIYNEMEELISEQYSTMLSFLLSQWENVVDFIPDLNMIKNPSTAKILTNFVINKSEVDYEKIKDFLHWPMLKELPKDIQNKQEGKGLIKYDKLMELLETDVSNKKAYTLSNNAGSGKPCSTEKIESYIKAQKNKFNAKNLTPQANFSMQIEDFPKTSEGNHHITTAKNIVYLYDKWEDLKISIEKAYPRLKNKFNFDNNMPVFIYVSNSLKLGRIFGDPYTGQLAAFSTAFGHFDTKKRLVIAYFPHQVHSQIEPNKKNKGLVLMKELTDLIIFHGGVAVNLEQGNIL